MRELMGTQAIQAAFAAAADDGRTARRLSRRLLYQRASISAPVLPLRSGGRAF